jgi:hypothetical protein
MKERREVEIVEQFKLRIAGITFLHSTWQREFSRVTPPFPA